MPEGWLGGWRGRASDRIARAVHWITSIFFFTNRYLHDVAKWLWNTHALTFICLAAIAVMLCFGFAPCAEQKIRWSGMVLQLIGVVLVGVGLRDTRRAFEGHPTTWQAVMRWWAGRPKFGPQNVTIAAVGGALAMATGSARARVGPGPATPLEQRVDLLERQYVQLFDEVGVLDAKVKRNAEELKNEIKAERHERQLGEDRAKEQLKKALAEGLPLARVGASCFFVGIVAASISPELARVVSAGGSCP